MPGPPISDMQLKHAMKVRGNAKGRSCPRRNPCWRNTMLFDVMQPGQHRKTKRLQEKGWREPDPSRFAPRWRDRLLEHILPHADRAVTTGLSQLAGEHWVKSSFFYPSVGASVVPSQLVPEECRRTSPTSNSVRSCASVGGGSRALPRQPASQLDTRAA